MLNDDPKKLRFWGMDLHSQGRRRAAVVLTYSLFLLALAGVQTFFDDHPAHSDRWTLPGGFWELMTMVLVTVAFCHGIFRENGPVKRFGPHRLFSRYGDRLILETRDDWARYLYEKSLAELSPEQQTEVKRRWRPGKYLVKDKPFFAPGLPDERELAEIGSASRRALSQLSLLTMATAFAFAHRGFNVHPDTLTVVGLQLFLAAETFPKAVILWSEPDPRQFLELEESSVGAQS